MVHFVFEFAKYTPKKRLDLVENQKALIMPLGDVHYGSRDWPESKFKTHLEWGMDRGAYFLGMGEYLDAFSNSQRALIGPMRDSAKELVDNMMRDRAMQLIDILKPTKGRWIGFLEGDHRWDFQDGNSVDQLIVRHIGGHFLGTSAMIRFRFNGVPKGHPEADCTLFCHHGTGASQTQGGSLNKVENMLKAFDADIYLMGHVHSKLGAPIDQQQITPDGIHTHRTKLIARTGAWLLGYASSEPLSLDEPVIKSRGTYVEQKAFIPSALGGLAIGLGVEQIQGSKFFRPLIHIAI